MSSSEDIIKRKNDKLRALQKRYDDLLLSSTTEQTKAAHELGVVKAEYESQIFGLKDQLSGCSLVLQQTIEETDTRQKALEADKLGLLRTAALRETQLIDIVTTNDAVFLFPVKGTCPIVYRELWASSEYLKHKSSYFIGLFDGGFQESAKVSMSYPSPKSINATDFDESDSDTQAETKEPTKNLTLPRHLYQLVIKHTLYRTYRAFLHYLYTGTVVFAELKSVTVFRSENRVKEGETKGTTSQYAQDSAQVLFQKHAAKDAKEGTSYDATAPHMKISKTAPLGVNTPDPVSPKSLYRLAHLVSHYPLQQLCLSHLHEALIVPVLIHELFSPFSLLYDDYREEVMRITVNRWHELGAGGGGGRDSLKIELTEGDTVAKASVSVDLMNKLCRRPAPTSSQ